MKPAQRPYLVPAMFRGGHDEAEQVLVLVNELVRPLGWQARLECPERQRAYTSTICLIKMEPALDA